MQTLKELRAELRNSSGRVTSINVKTFFASKGYKVCNVTPISHSNNWFAILIRNKEFVIATLFTNGIDIERYESSVMP
ncbi:hypothetical protein BH10BAC1_BH10BAC1_21290 [soil metagenome]